MSGSSINMSTFVKDSNNIEVCESRFVELELKFHENTPYMWLLKLVADCSRD